MVKFSLIRVHSIFKASVNYSRYYYEHLSTKNHVYETKTTVDEIV